MFDKAARKIIDPPLNMVGRFLAGAGVSADLVTACGFAVGLAALPLIAAQLYGWGLAAILANRVFDGIDGAVARHSQVTDFGGYLDIVCDFIFYAAVPVGFALAVPDVNALAAIVLVFSFVGTGSSFLGFAIVAAKRGIGTRVRGPKSFFYLGGLTEGSETIAFFVAICLWPGAFVPLALVFSGFAWITVISRIAMAWSTFGSENDEH